jgi:nitrogen regulatory protein PII
MLDFEQSSLDELVQPAFLVTIICEAVLRDSVVGLLRNLKVQSYTVTNVTGQGRCGSFADATLAATAKPIGDDPDQMMTEVELEVEIRALASKDLSNVILHTLKEQQRNFSIVAYRQTVEALAAD